MIRCDNKAQDGVMNFQHWRKRPEVKEYEWPLEGGKENETNSPL